MSEKDNFLEQINNMAKNVEEFKPFKYYNPDGDYIEVFLKRDSYFAEQISETITVYKSRATNEIVGLVLNNIKKDIENDK